MEIYLKGIFVALFIPLFSCLKNGDKNRSMEVLNCDLAKSPLNFTYMKLQWACKKFCPNIKGCLAQCCRDKEPTPTVFVLPSEDGKNQESRNREGKGSSCSMCIIVPAVGAFGLFVIVSCVIRKRPLKSIERQIREVVMASFQAEKKKEEKKTDEKRRDEKRSNGTEASDKTAKGAEHGEMLREVVVDQNKHEGECLLDRNEKCLPQEFVAQPEDDEYEAVSMQKGTIMDTPV